MNRHGTGAAAAAGFGVGFLLAGTALLLQELDLLTLRWSFVLPLIVITAGVAVVLSGLVGAHRSRPSAGASAPDHALPGPADYLPEDRPTPAGSAATPERT
jgi:hypothetical protein